MMTINYCYIDELELFSNSASSYRLLRGHMTSNNKNVSSQRIRKHCEIYDGLLPANVDRGPSLQRGLLNVQLQNFQQYDKSFNDWSLGKQLFCFLESQVLMTIGAAPGTFPWWDKTRRVAGVLEGVFGLKMKFPSLLQKRHLVQRKLIGPTNTKTMKLECTLTQSVVWQSGRN